MILPSTTLATASTLLPVDYGELAEHLRLDSDEEELYLTALLEGARDYIERLCGRATLSATYLLTAPTWASVLTSCGTGKMIVPDRTPLISVSSVKYIAEGATSLTTMSSGDYAVVTAWKPGGVLFANGYDFPDLNTDRPDAVQVTFAAGHAEVADVPASLRHAIKLLAAHWYENRLPVAAVNLTEIPHTLRDLINHHRERGAFS
jgi:uncharacterized phiE125 gp8 family phage protein